MNYLVLIYNIIVLFFCLRLLFIYIILILFHKTFFSQIILSKVKPKKMSSVEQVFWKELNGLSKLKNDRECMLLESIEDYEEEYYDSEPTLEHYHKINKIFIEGYCHNQYKRLTEAFDISIADHWDCGDSYENTSTAGYKHRVFEQEIHFIFGLTRVNKDKHGFNAFIALFVCRLDWEWAFHDTEDHQTAQQLIYSLCFLFDYFMKKSIKEIGYGNETKTALHKLMVTMDVNLENLTFMYARLEEYLNSDDDMDGYFREMKNKVYNIYILNLIVIKSHLGINQEKPEMKNIQELSLKERNEWITYGFIRMISSNEANADIKKLILEFVWIYTIFYLFCENIFVFDRLKIDIGHEMNWKH